ncbi:type II toxin-antitoxin system RelE/ParE family toxin [Streptomyces sp. NPDC006670]|uniref:type II toxin-antitoxin system RelE/ParE family toxin n=1 Tax=Streptomyces sp. NPDC006670 TaxID=3154476 RepID=UPI00340034DD
MEDLFTVEIEPEVRLWLMNLSDADYLVAEHAVGLLVDAPTTLGEPYARHLGGGVRELRFMLGHNREAVRLSYRLAHDRRIVLLTVFRKTKQREVAEVDRAVRAGRVCESSHGPAVDVYTRDV